MHTSDLCSIVLLEIDDKMENFQFHSQVSCNFDVVRILCYRHLNENNLQENSHSKKQSNNETKNAFDKLPCLSPPCCPLPRF